MTDAEILGVFIIVAYLLGSIPFGLIVGLANGVDPRQAGSGNIGATNVGRLLGGRYFALVFVLDLMKSLLPMLTAGLVLRGQHNLSDYLLWMLVGFSAILGHMFSVFLGFRGGKGVATSAGVMLGLFPYYTCPSLVAFAAFLLLFFSTRYVSLASMGGAIVFPVAYLAIGVAAHWPILHQQLPLLVFAVVVGVLVVVRHRGEHWTAAGGTESRVGKGS